MEPGFSSARNHRWPLDSSWLEHQHKNYLLRYRYQTKLLKLLNCSKRWKTTWQAIKRRSGSSSSHVISPAQKSLSFLKYREKNHTNHCQFHSESQFLAIDHSYYYGGPSKAEPFFPTTCGPKNRPAILDRNAPVYVQEGRMPLQPTPFPPISMLLEAAAKKPSSKQKGPLTSEKPIRVHNTEIRRGAGRPVIQTDLHYNVSPSLLKHCLSVIQSVQAPSARIFPKPGKAGQYQSSGCEINEEWAFTHMEVMAGQM